MRSCLLAASIALGFAPIASAQLNPTATGYDSHVELNWSSLDAPCRIYASPAGRDDFQLRGQTTQNYYLDFTTDLGRNLALDYRLVPLVDHPEFPPAAASAATRDFSDDELLEMVQRYTFRYFWDYADPATGLARERLDSPKGNVVTIGGSGFGLLATIAAAHRGWISRDQALDRFLLATDFLASTDRFHGMWAHWYDADTLRSFPFSEKDNGGDLVESAFMAQALLTARQYFNRPDPRESTLRERITRLWHEMEWNFYTNGNEHLLWHWSPDHGFAKNHAIRGYNECLIAYVLAASSPTHPIDPEAYHKGWAGWDNETFANYSTYYGIALPLGNKRWFGGPLFFTHYSFLALDPRGLRDRYADYWQQNRRHTLINRAYCIDNPYGFKGYGPDFWGLTAGDRVPAGYTAHAPGYRRDFGTINPTAAISSIPYTPEESLAVLKNLYRNHGRHLLGPYGFYDAINLSLSDNPTEQVRKSYIAIDQGPIVVMIENHRSALLWNLFMQDPDLQQGLQRLDFSTTPPNSP